MATTKLGDITLTKQSGTNLTLSTEGTYVATDVSFTLAAQSATPAFTGGGVTRNSMDITSGQASVSSTNNSGVSLVGEYSYTRNAVTYQSNVSGWVDQSSGDVALSSLNGTSSVTRYINGVTITAPSSGTRTFSVTVPNGNTTATFVFNVDSSGNVTITES